MHVASLPANEDLRLEALRALAILDSGPEEEFDALVKVASIVCGVPISLISLIDSERQWFKANIGLPGVHETPRDVAFCAHAILDQDVFEVPDASKDERFFDNPLVTSNPDIRFYAGAPIVLTDGSRIGTLCVIDRQPNTLSTDQREVLQQLAKCASQALDGRRAMRVNVQMSAALRKSETLLERTGKLAGIGGFEVDFATGTRTWSRETFSIYGLEPDSTPDFETAIKFYPPEARAKLIKAMQAAQIHGEAYDLELPFVRADGKNIWVRTVGAVEHEDGKPARLVGLIQDITARRNEQAVLTEAQERIKLATESAGIGIWDFDLITSALHWNEHQYRLYGLEPNNEIAAYDLWSRHVHPDDLAAAELALQTAIANRTDFIQDFRIVWPDGTVHNIRAMGRLRYDAQGNAVRMVGTNMDITEVANHAQSLKDARDKAEEASRSKGQFLANMSHEIRTPMNAILGLLQLLRSTELNSTQFDYVEKTEGAAKALLGLLNDILDFSKMDAGKMELEHEPFSIDAMMRNLGVVLSASIGRKNIEVLYDIDTNLPDWLIGDSMRILQVLINLGGNAVKFTSDGQIVISARLEQIDSNTNATGQSKTASVHFSVQDSGIGIAPENQIKVFGDFSQAEASTTRKFGGTGLGLAICKRLVALMGGEISLTSELGIGTTFSFTLKLPVSDYELEVQHPSTVRAPRILLVDDNTIALDLMAGMMRANAWSVDLTSNGLQALKMIRRDVAEGRSSYDFVFLDWQLCDIDAWEVVAELSTVRQTLGSDALKIIMVSSNGRDNLGLRTQEEQSQISGFLVKPVTRSMLSDVTRGNSVAVTNIRREERGSSKRELEGLRILVVEDNAINQQVAEGLLGAQGASVSIAADGRQGVNAIATAKKQYDIVLMDVQMPVMDGYEATHVIRERLGLKQLPIVGLTANAMATDRDKCLAAGMNEHVGKPFDLAKLISIVIRLTGRRPASNLPPAPAAGGACAVNGPTEPDAFAAISGEIDVPSALQRMGGMHALYASSARDLLKDLPSLTPKLKDFVLAGDLKGAANVLHTFKGTTATLGRRPPVFSSTGLWSPGVNLTAFE